MPHIEEIRGKHVPAAAVDTIDPTEAIATHESSFTVPLEPLQARLFADSTSWIAI